MLGNNADAFFTKPMRTSIVRGNLLNAQAGMMPAPFDSGSNTKTVTVKAGSMLPGLQGYRPRRNNVTQFNGVGDDTTPVAAATAATPVVAEAQKFLGMSVGTLAIVGSLAFLFLTAPGAQLRAKIGF